MKISAKLGHATAVAAVAGALLTVGGGPAAAIAPGCFSGQVGLYNQSDWDGNCYGFAGSNTNYDPWPGIKDNMRSAWNGGTSSRACIYRDKNYANYILGLNVDSKWSQAAAAGAESNRWVANGGVCL